MLRPLAPPPSSPRLFESELTTPRSPRAWEGEGWAGLTVLPDNSAHPGLLPVDVPPTPAKITLKPPPTPPRLGSRPWASLHTRSPPPCAPTQPTATLAVRAPHRRGRSLRGVSASRARPHSRWAKSIAGSGRSPSVAQSGPQGAAARRRLPGPSDNGDPSGATTGVGVREANGDPRPLLSPRQHPGANAAGLPSWPRPFPTTAAPPESGDKAQAPPEPHTKRSDPHPSAPQGPAAPPAVSQLGADSKTQPIPSIPSPWLPAGSSKNPTPTCPLRAAWPH